MSTSAELAAKRYAEALWSSLAVEEAKKTLSSLEKFVEIFLSSEDLQKLFSNPAFSSEDKKKILKEIFNKVSFSQELQNFLLLLLESDRINILGSILESYREKIMTQEGVASVKIETALPMTETQQKKIISSLEKEFSTKFVSSVDIVPELVAGIRVHFLGRTIDSTLTGVLFQMQNKFMEERTGN